jgi:hypothetical protein
MLRYLAAPLHLRNFICVFPSNSSLCILLFLLPLLLLLQAIFEGTAIYGTHSHSTVSRLQGFEVMPCANNRHVPYKFKNENCDKAFFLSNEEF